MTTNRHPGPDPGSIQLCYPGVIWGRSIVEIAGSCEAVGDEVTDQKHGL